LLYILLLAGWLLTRDQLGFWDSLSAVRLVAVLIISGDAKYNVTQMGRFIYQMNRIFEENSDLESVFAYMLHSTLYRHRISWGMRMG